VQAAVAWLRQHLGLGRSPPTTNSKGSNKARLVLTPHTFPDERTIPLWDWAYGRLLLRETVTTTVAIGGTGKSSLGSAEALALTTGRALLGIEVPRPLRVLLVNLEDNVATK
jgi:AAA domain